MSLSRDVSQTLDILTQQPGAILYRDTDRWRALDPGEPGLYLAIDDEGMPSWFTGQVPPDVSTDWIAPTLIEGWVNFGGMWQTARYRKTNEAIVHIQGLVKGGTVGAGKTVFVLPEGFRPNATLQIPIISNNALGIINVHPDGRVQPASGSSSAFNLNSVFGLNLP